MARIVPEWVKKRIAKGSAKGAGIKHGFRSGLEDSLAEQIASRGLPVLFETTKLRYVVPQTERTYTPDFWLPNGIIIEGKGIFDSTDRAKHLFIKEQYGGLLDIRFVFSRSASPIGPGAKMRLAEWCRKYGYQFSDKRIPEAWFDEPGPEHDPMDIIKAGPFGYLKLMENRK